MHRAVLWGEMMIIHGGRFQSALGDMWKFNISEAVQLETAELRDLERSDSSVWYAALAMVSCFAAAFIIALLKCRLYLRAATVSHLFQPFYLRYVMPMFDTGCYFSANLSRTN